MNFSKSKSKSKVTKRIKVAPYTRKDGTVVRGSNRTLSVREREAKIANDISNAFVLATKGGANLAKIRQTLVATNLKKKENAFKYGPVGIISKAAGASNALGQGFYGVSRGTDLFRGRNQDVALKMRRLALAEKSFELKRLMNDTSGYDSMISALRMTNRQARR